MSSRVIPGCFMILLLGGCSATAPRQATVSPPPLVPIQSDLEPMPMPISGELETREILDPIGLSVLEAGIQVERTRRLLTALWEADGFRWPEQHFDRAVVDDLRDIPELPASLDPELRKILEEHLRSIQHDLPIEINDRVLAFLNYYRNGRGERTMAAGLERVGRYRPLIERVLTEEGVPLDLIYLAQAESLFLPLALSRAQARGIWQFIPSRGKEYGLRQNAWIDERSDPEKSTRAAARHLRDLYEEFGNWFLAMAAYNSGPARVQNALKRTGAESFWQLADRGALPQETINYIPTVLAMSIIGKNPAKYGFDVTPAEPLETERVRVEKATDLRVIADAMQIPLDHLRALNTHVLRWTTPPDDAEFELIIPLGYGGVFNERVASLPDDKRILFHEHVVRRGDTVSAIARQYGSTIAEVSEINKLGRNHLIRVGQTLIVPAGAVTPAQTASNQPRNSSGPTPTSYTVRRGDTLGKIATQFAVTVDAILAWNKANDLSVIHPGDRIALFVTEE